MRSRTMFILQQVLLRALSARWSKRRKDLRIICVHRLREEQFEFLFMFAHVMVSKTFSRGEESLNNIGICHTRGVCAVKCPARHDNALTKTKFFHIQLPSLLSHISPRDRKLKGMGWLIIERSLNFSCSHPYADAPDNLHILLMLILACKQHRCWHKVKR